MCFEYGSAIFYASKHQSVFICQMVLFFLISEYFFLCSNSFHFSSSETFLYRSQPYCTFWFFFSSERSWYLSRAFLKPSFNFFDSRRIFKHFCMWKKNYIKNPLMLKTNLRLFIDYFYQIFYESLNNHLKIT